MKNPRLFIIILIFIFSCHNSVNESEVNHFNNDNLVSMINFSVVKQYKHDNTLFTEGFVFHNNKLYESTGAPEELPQTKTLIGVSDLNTGKFKKVIELDKRKYFGEGIVFLKSKLYQLTYKNKICFVYDTLNYKISNQFKYNNIEGWGLTSDGTNIIMSDGTSTITYLNPNDFKVVKSLKVTENGEACKNINELEFIHGYIYANVWQTNFIVKINPANGNVLGKLDLSDLYTEAKMNNPNCDVLNGIAYDSVTNKIYVTGKLWNNIYQIDFEF